LIPLILIFSAGCATTRPSQQKAEEDLPVAEEVNLVAVQKFLKLHPPKDELGLVEKKFTDCDFGKGPLIGNECQKVVFTLVHFQVLCRGSEGTVEFVSQTELVPFATQTIRWWSNPVGGYTSTDDDGYGQFRFITPVSQRRKGVHFKTGVNSLKVELGEITRIIVPQDWCSE